MRVMLLQVQASNLGLIWMDNTSRKNFHDLSIKFPPRSTLRKFRMAPNPLQDEGKNNTDISDKFGPQMEVTKNQKSPPPPSYCDSITKMSTAVKLQVKSAAQSFINFVHYQPRDRTHD